MAKEDHVGVGEWLLFHLMMALPLVNLIMLIYWSCSSRTKISKQNFARSYFVVLGITVLLVVLFGLFAAGSIPVFQEIRERAMQSTQEFTQESAEPVAAAEPATSYVVTPSPVEPVSDYRRFTSLDGWNLEAKVVRIDEDVVQLERSDGSMYTASVELFSPEDRAYLSTLDR